jgi:hypothetical protein
MIQDDTEKNRGRLMTDDKKYRPIVLFAITRRREAAEAA